MNKGMLLISLCFMALLAQAQESKGTSPKKVLIKYVHAHLGNGEVIENAYVAYQGEEFIQVSDANSTRINESDFDTVINADGKHIFPGFTVMDSRLGLTEIDQVRATQDFDETGRFLPNVRALPAYNSDSKITPTVWVNGVLNAQIAPKGGRISGSSSLVSLNGEPWTEAVVRADDGIFLNWPKRFKKTGWWAEPGVSKWNMKYAEEKQKIVEYFKEAKAYHERDSGAHKNLRFEAMRGLFDGEKRLFVRVEWAKDILDVVQFYRECGVQKISLVGASEADLVATELVENKISVVIDRVHKLPVHDDDPLDRPYELPSLLFEKGVEFCFATSGSMEAMISRNLPFQVGTSVQHGLPYEEAIRALCSTPARLMGVEDLVGTIEPGMKATFFLCEGDPLDIQTNKLEWAVINGKEINLVNRQEELYLKYSKKHGLNQSPK